MDSINPDLNENPEIQFQTAIQEIKKLHENSFNENPEELMKWIDTLFIIEKQLKKPNIMNIETRVALLDAHLEAAIKLSNFSAAWEDIQKIVCLRPYMQDKIILIPKIAEKVRTRPRQKVILVISCWPRLELAKKTRDIFAKILNDQFQVLIVVGQKHLNMENHYIDGDLLIVGVPDNYESLPYKIRAALQFVYKTFESGTCCFKIDEDLNIINQDTLKILLNNLSTSYANYAGFCGNNKYFQERTSHFGKCANLEISYTPFAKKFHGPYAYGGLYYLSYEALEKFTIESLSFSHEILGEIYEDKYVGDTLRNSAITITALEPLEWNQAIGQDWWITNRCWYGPTLRLL